MRQKNHTNCFSGLLFGQCHDVRSWERDTPTPSESQLRHAVRSQVCLRIPLVHPKADKGIAKQEFDVSHVSRQQSVHMSPSQVCAVATRLNNDIPGELQNTCHHGYERMVEQMDYCFADQHGLPASCFSLCRSPEPRATTPKPCQIKASSLGNTQLGRFSPQN